MMTTHRVTLLHRTYLRALMALTLAALGGCATYERCGRNGRRQGRCGERRWIGAHAQMSAEHPFVDLSSAVGSRGQKTQDEESIPLEMAEHKRPDQNVDEREQEVLCLLPGGHLRLLRMRPGLSLPRALPETDREPEYH